MYYHDCIFFSLLKSTTKSNFVDLVKLSRVTALEKMELSSIKKTKIRAALENKYMSSDEEWQDGFITQSQGFPVLTILRKTEVSCEHFR
jgi:hypothetical protein